MAKKIEDLFPATEPKRRLTEKDVFPEAEQKFIDRTIHGMDDEEALVAIITDYSMNRKRLARRGMICSEQAGKDIIRARQLLDTLTTKLSRKSKK